MRRLMLSLMLAGALGASTMGHAQAPAEASVQVVTVKLSSFRFTPSTLTLRRGTVYQLRLSNTSSGGHDFVAKEFFAASTVAPEDRAKLGRDGGVDVDSGETVTLRVVPNRPGMYKLHCSHFMHSTFGMTGTIVVQ